MSHLPDIALPRFEKGKPLSAADLNRAFQVLLSAVDVAMATALTPDAASVQNEVHIAAHEQRIATIERMLAMHERQRNEKAWAPLAHVAALMQLMLEIRGPLAAKAAQLEDAQKAVLQLHADVVRRVARLEQQPEPATREEHAALAEQHKEIAQKAHIALTQAVALRQETGQLRKLALGHDRLANRLEFAPLSTVGFILQRLKELEARLPEAPS